MGLARVPDWEPGDEIGVSVAARGLQFELYRAAEAADGGVNANPDPGAAGGSHRAREPAADPAPWGHGGSQKAGGRSLGVFRGGQGGSPEACTDDQTRPGGASHCDE